MSDPRIDEVKETLRHWFYGAFTDTVEFMDLLGDERFDAFVDHYDALQAILCEVGEHRDDGQGCIHCNEAAA